MNLQELKQEMLQNRLCIENIGDRVEDLRFLLELVSNKVGIDINKEYILRHGEQKIDVETIEAIRAEYRKHKMRKSCLADKFGVTQYQIDDIIEFA